MTRVSAICYTLVMVLLSRARLLAALCPVVIYAFYLHWYYGRAAAGGKAAFLQHQSARFDLYYANGGSWGFIGPLPFPPSLSCCWHMKAQLPCSPGI